jgi:hypothetical protein
VVFQPVAGVDCKSAQANEKLSASGGWLLAAGGWHLATGFFALLPIFNLLSKRLLARS